MVDRGELKWTECLSRSLPFLERTYSEHALLVVAYVVLYVFGALVQAASFWTNLVTTVIYLLLACGAIRAVWLDELGEEAAAGVRLSHGGPPLLSLVLLQVIFIAGSVAALLMLVAPLVWWVTKSSLAVVAVCVEDLGAIEALRKSHKLTEGKFLRTLGFIFPTVLVVALPCAAAGIGLDYGLSLLPQLSGEAIVFMGGLTIAALVKAVCGLTAQILVVASLTRLYAGLTGEAAGEGEPEAAP